MNQPLLTILMPLFNELDFINSCFEKNWNFLSEWNESFTIEFRFCVWTSSESQQTVDSLRRMTAAWSSRVVVQIFEGGGASPSVVGSLKLGVIKPIESRYVLICPVDCSIAREGLREIHSLFSDNKVTSVEWCVFKKRYDRSNPPLLVSSLLQNWFIAPILGLHCWTNLFFVRTDHFPECFPQKFFLEDLFANRELHARFGRPHRFKSLVEVSARRYRHRGSLKQILINCRTFLCYLRNSTDLTNLRNFYEKKSKP
jgi:hypothetical protein